MFFGSFSTKVPELQDEGWSDDPLAGEPLPGSGVPGAGAEPGVDGRVLNVLVAQPVLREVDVPTGVQDVRADGVFSAKLRVAISNPRQ